MDLKFGYLLPIRILEGNSNYILSVQNESTNLNLINQHKLLEFTRNTKTGLTLLISAIVFFFFFLEENSV